MDKKDKNKQGAIIVGTETIYKCVIEDKFYNVKTSQPYFVQMHRSFNVIPGQLAGGRGRLVPLLELVSVCETCFKNPDYQFDMPENIEEMDSFDPKKEKVKTTVQDIPGLRRN